MNVYTKGDRVAISDKHGTLSSDWAKVGRQGTVVSTAYDIVRVKFDDLDDEMSINQVWIEPIPKTQCRVIGPKGFTETLSEAQVKGLVAAGILHHIETHVHDDYIVKIYKSWEARYTVRDYRSNVVSLEEQFPQEK